MKLAATRSLTRTHSPFTSSRLIQSGDSTVSVASVVSVALVVLIALVVLVVVLIVLVVLVDFCHNGTGS